jgi:hypothetical protein
LKLVQPSQGQLEQKSMKSIFAPIGLEMAELASIKEQLAPHLIEMTIESRILRKHLPLA